MKACSSSADRQSQMRRAPTSLITPGFIDDDRAVTAILNYVTPGEPPVTLSDGPDLPEVRASGTLDPQWVSIRNGRRIASDATLDREGFRFFSNCSRVSDFCDETEIRDIYSLEIEALIRAETGAVRVKVFDPTLRSAACALRGFPLFREPVLRVHCDFTKSSGAQPIRDLLSEEADELMRRRWAIVQVWRPIRQPVESYPLAIADARSVLSTDLVITKRIYPNWVGETYSLLFRPSHRWYWFPRMRPDEVLMFKVFDSLDDGRARWVAHTAFDDPTIPSGARPRESIEIRALAIF